MNTRRPADVSGQPYSSNMHSNDASKRNEDHLQGHWSNGDPVHVVTDGAARRVAPNLNGATWVPPEFDRYREHDRVREFGGTCSCGSTYPAPESAPEALDLDAIEARVAAASPAEEWNTEVDDDTDDDEWCISRTVLVLTVGGEVWLVARNEDDESDIEFVAHARTDVPALIAEVRRLREITGLAEAGSASKAEAVKFFRELAAMVEQDIESADDVREFRRECSDAFKALGASE